jgi:hypothetical protein
VTPVRVEDVALLQRQELIAVMRVAERVIEPGYIFVAGNGGIALVADEDTLIDPATRYDSVKRLRAQ